MDTTPPPTRSRPGGGLGRLFTRSRLFTRICERMGYGLVEIEALRRQAVEHEQLLADRAVKRETIAALKAKLGQGQAGAEAQDPSAREGGELERKAGRARCAGRGGSMRKSRPSWSAG